MSFNGRQAPIDEEELEKHRTTGKNNKRCQACNGPLVFDPTSQKMKCEYCESEYDIPRELDENELTEAANAPRAQQGQPPLPGTQGTGSAGSARSSSGQAQNPAHRARNRKGERPLEEAKEPSQEACDWGAQKKMVTCKTCGAQTIYDSVQTISTCPYCDSNQILEEPDQKDSIAPTGICVFKIDRNKAKEQFSSWVSGLWFAPNKLKKVASAGQMEGVYLPHWTYDTQAYADYRGEYGIDKKDSNNRTTTDWYKCSGSIEHFFDDYLIPACKKENNHILESLAPFNTNDYEDYKPEYMVGYAAEKYSVTVHEGWEIAKKRLNNDLHRLAEKDIKHRNPRADKARVKQLDAEFTDIMYKYLMLPIWISSYRYNGKVYQFMVNGQTGKVSGDRPYSGWKIFFAVLCALAIIYFFMSGSGKG
ncbi:MAG: hypothetical protein Q4F00_13050 [bacterium]|nr:hypothetical protein [bacterium]